MTVDDILPVVCLAPDSVSAYDIFNPNDWSGQSHVIVHSCAFFAGVMKHNVERIHELCATGRKVCRARFEQFAASMDEPRNVVGRVRPLAQVPELHSAIVALLVNAKTVLDLLTQLTCAEGVVKAVLHGFHKGGDRLLNSLEQNAPESGKEAAEALADVIRRHKGMWIDGLIKARDRLAHPKAGAVQLMFEMQIDTSADGPLLTGVIPPKVGGQPVDQYAREVERRCHEFARSMLDCLAKPRRSGHRPDAPGIEDTSGR